MLTGEKRNHKQKKNNNNNKQEVYWEALDLLQGETERYCSQGAKRSEILK
jgi:hypothetical protein